MDPTDRNGGLVTGEKIRIRRRAMMMGTTTTTIKAVELIIPRIVLLLLFLFVHAIDAGTTIDMHTDSNIEDTLNSAALPQHDDQNTNQRQKEQSPPQPRIINGEDVTDPDRYPWFVHVRGSTPDNLPVLRACGGSLIAPDLVLTAAHCE
jgi:V8-like Glu-specific endopeptidase